MTTTQGTGRVAAWAAAAREQLIETATSYNGVVTYAQLADVVQVATGIHTRQLLQHWIGDVLGAVADECGRRGEPVLSALCVDRSGSVGDGYAKAVLRVRGARPDDADDHAAHERLDCYLFFGADLPPDGGCPTLTRQVQAKRDRQRATRQAARRGERCTRCNMETPLSGTCDFVNERPPPPRSGGIHGARALRTALQVRHRPAEDNVDRHSYLCTILAEGGGSCPP